MDVRNNQISTLVEDQLPGFIVSEYENFSKLLTSYYEQQELQGNPLDIINNILSYKDINFYDNDIIKESTKLSSNINSSIDVIQVEDGSSFPLNGGYVKIGSEICFYKQRIDNTFVGVSRGVSGNTRLGDLYYETEYVSSEAESHLFGEVVYNISNLFLYAFVKSFEDQYLNSFPEEYLKDSVDKRLLIKNISDFYKAKGTEKSIKFIFNSIVSKSPEDIPETYNPKDYTFKSSSSTWISDFVLRVKVLSGDPESLIGELVVQEQNVYDKDSGYASAIIDNVVFYKQIDGELFYDLILQKESINGDFLISSKTNLTAPLPTTKQSGGRIDVFSTLGWKNSGAIVIRNEIITFEEKTVNQFVIKSRGSSIQYYNTGEVVYSFSPVQAKTKDGIVRLIVVGSVQQLSSDIKYPYCSENDPVLKIGPGFETRDPIIFDEKLPGVRWRINETAVRPNIASNPALNAMVQEYVAGVSAIYEDDTFYYICTSGYPSFEILNSTVSANLYDPKHLKLLNKVPETTTEIYPTPTRDVGICVDGSLIFGYKDEEFINFGKLTNIELLKKGSGYKRPPFVLVNNQPKKALSILSGDVVDSIKITTEDIFTQIPQITIVSGRNAEISAVVTSGKITSLKITNQGEYYSSPPLIRISDRVGRGRFAEYRAVVSFEGKLVDTIKVEEGKFYTQENVIVEIIPDASNSPAVAKAEIKKWFFNRYNKISSNLDDNGGYIFKSLNDDSKYSYGIVANPKDLRVLINDNILSTYAEPAPNTIKHSPIIGYAYDGNPIYGPFAFEDPFDSTSSIVRMESGYSLRSSRTNGPPISTYPLGSFIDDYKWVPTVRLGKNLLDQNNGRYCVTPDYPSGVYAYFITIDSANTPKYPYVLGENYYSLPVSSNYTETITQEELPKNIKRLKTSLTPQNGTDDRMIINTISTGNVSGVTVDDSLDIYSVGSRVFVDDKNTNGFGASAFVSSVFGKSVTKIDSKQIKSLQINVEQNCYLFDGGIITQSSTNATGVILGDVIDTNRIFLKNVSGQFNTTNLISSNTVVLNLLLDSNASYTENSILTLQDEDDNEIATGIVLNKTTSQNSVRVKVTNGSFSINSDYILKSSVLSDSVGIKIISFTNISQSLKISNIDDSIAIGFTSSNHDLSEGDIIDLDITPNDAQTTTTISVKKKLYQELTLLEPSFSGLIIDSGIGRFDLLNTGVDYQAGTYNNVELIFSDSSKARNGLGISNNSKNALATIVVSNDSNGYGKVASITITSKGIGYKIGDILTVVDSKLNRLGTSQSNSRLILQVDFAGFSLQNTTLKLNKVLGLSVGDLLQISDEIVQIASINSSSKQLVVTRGFNNTRPIDHSDGREVVYAKPKYRFIRGNKIFGNTINDPIVESYNEDTQKLILSYEFTANSPRNIVLSSSFLDESSPKKPVAISSIDSRAFKLQFSQNNVELINPIIEIQKYYQYIFDTSHFSMIGSYLDFSTSKNYNIYTGEKEVSPVEPGNPGSFVKIKIGFSVGDKGDTGFVREKVKTDFSTYYYFIVTPDVNTDQSYLKVVDDPLSGIKELIYTTADAFVYNLDKTPQYDGTGVITYTTTSTSAIGKINSVTVDNLGQDYALSPIVEGVLPSPSNESILDCVFDASTQQIVSVSIVSPGSGYSKPKIVLVSGDGTGAEFDVTQRNGKIIRVDVLNKGNNYSFKPLLKVIETNNKLFFESSTIGTPSSISFINYGSAFNSDYSLLSNYRSPYILLLKNFELDSFYDGETIIQKSNGIVVAKGVVSKNGWRKGSNILKIERVEGTFKKDLSIVGVTRNKSAFAKEVFYSQFSPIIETRSKNLGRFESDYGKVSSNTQRIHDSNFYQDYSYVIESKTSINEWRNAIKETTHPAGFKLFGELNIHSSGVGNMPGKINPTETVTIYLIVPPAAISSLTTTRTITESIIKVNDLNVKRGSGSVSVDSSDLTQTRAREIYLSPQFNGRLDPSTGQKIGTKTFTILDKQFKTPYIPYNNQELFITLDGIIQEPGLSYNVSGNQITFTEPPLGSYVIEGQETNEQSFYGRSFKFRDDIFNQKYLKKLKDISLQFNGKEKEFDLYYENNSIVKTDLNENLLIFLNGVLQNNYTIKRYKTPSKTDKIIFDAPPINHEDLIEDIPRDINGAERFFGYSVGSYERLTIDERVIPFVPSGPYLILDKFTQKIKKIDDPLYAYVFVDGVLQKNDDSYVINGPNITFNKPLTYAQLPTGEYTYPSVEILYFYGKDSEKTLTFYNFEEDSYYNIATFAIQGQGSYDAFISWYEQYLSVPVYMFQEETVGVENMLGEIINVKNIDSTNWQIQIRSNNVDVNSDSLLQFTTNPGLNADISDRFVLFVPNQFSISYDTNDSGERILTRKKSKFNYRVQNNYLFDDFRYSEQMIKASPNILPGDTIQIDGEFATREIKTIPLYAKTTQYNKNEQVSNHIFGTLTASEYNGDVYGEGFSVTATIKNGKVSGLKWNRRDLMLYFNNNLLLQPTAYQYYTPPVITFIPVDGNGGGAKAEVVVYGGQIIDIVLIDSGYGYTKPPKTAISRGYNIIRQRNKLDTVATLSIAPNIDLQSSLQFFSETNLYDWKLVEPLYNDVLLSSPLGNEQEIIRILYCEDKEVTLKSSSSFVSLAIYPQINVDSISSVTTTNQTTFVLEMPSISFISSESEVEKSRTTGIVDFVTEPITNTQLYSVGKLGPTVSTFIENLLNDSGFANVSGISIEMLKLYYGFDELSYYNENRYNITSTTSYGVVINAGIPSIQEYGSFLDSPINSTDTIIYIPDTSVFSSSGKLLIGKEVVSYTSKLSDRFLGVTRGVDGTEATAHNAGEYLRTIGNTV